MIFTKDTLIKDILIMAPGSHILLIDKDVRCLG